MQLVSLLRRQTSNESDSWFVEVVMSSDLRQVLMEAGRGWSRSVVRLVMVATEFDSSGLWAIDGARTCAHWIADALEAEVSTAREWLRIGHALEQLDVLRQAFTDGRLSYSKVRTLTRVATPEHEAELCGLAEQTPAGRLSVTVAAWLAAHETPADTERRHLESCSMSSRVDPDGMMTIIARVPPLKGATVLARVDAQVRAYRRSGASTRDIVTPSGADASADACSTPNVMTVRSLRQQRADALVDLIVSGAEVSAEIVLHVRGDGCSLDDGTPIPGSVVERIAPEAFLRALIHDASSRPTNASGRRRHPSARQQRIVQARDRACVDCGSTEFLEYDHQPEFRVSGHTVVDELEVRCWYCHKARHEREKPA